MQFVDNDDGMCVDTKEECLCTSDNDLMVFKSKDGDKFRLLFETLDKILVEGNMVFTDDGIKIQEINQNSVLIDLFIGKHKWYYCKEPLTLGVSFSRLAKCLKTVTRNDTVTISYTEKSRCDCELNVEVISSNGDMFKMSPKLLDIESDKLGMEIELSDDSVVLTFESNRFQHIIRNCVNNGDNLQIFTSDKAVYFSSTGSFFDKLLLTVPYENTTQLEKLDHYKLKFISNAAKSSVMGDSVELILQKEYPLIIICKIGDIGILKFFIAPGIVGETDDFIITLKDVV
jgi:proliferating cell nuclear antigen PCNA